MTAAPARRLAALSAALALPLALLSATPAAAATVGVTTWDQIKAAFLVDGDTVRLDADITADPSEPLVIQANESIVFDLNGFALEITDPGSNNAAISVPSTSSLIINDTAGGGELTATGGDFSAGIGGSDDDDGGGTTTINSGTVTATGGIDGAGIGGGLRGDGGTTTINSGTVTATGGVDGAGIGGGFRGDGGTTTINGGTVTATGDAGGAGIGGGSFAHGGTTTINGGTTTATGETAGAGIGGGYAGDGGTTTLNGGTTTATGGEFAAGIGGGEDGDFGILAVNGTPDAGAATDGGDPPLVDSFASDITNPTMPAGVGYFATTSVVDGGGSIELRFTYLITFVTNGGSSIAPQTLDDGDTVTEPTEPTREGFTFTGWTSEGSAYDFSTPATGPLELSATWRPALADTGADVSGPLGLATLLLAGGIALIALRRRAHG